MKTSQSLLASLLFLGPQKFQLDRVHLQEVKRSSYEHTKKCADQLLLLGQVGITLMSLHRRSGMSFYFRSFQTLWMNSSSIPHISPAYTDTITLTRLCTYGLYGKWVIWVPNPARWMISGCCVLVSPPAEWCNLSPSMSELSR